MYVLKTGCQWAMVPAEVTGCSGKTAWRRMDQWASVGVWDALHEQLLTELNSQGAIDWTTGVVDGGSQRAVFWGAFTGPSPTDRAKNGVKSHALTDRTGVPLLVRVSAGNRHDVTQLLPLIDARRSALIRGRVGRPRGKTDRILADRGYDYDSYRRQLRARGITPVIARRLHRERIGPRARTLGR